jgi:hypothetical protein
MARRLGRRIAAVVGGDALVGASGRLLLLVVLVGVASGLAAACFVAVLSLLTGVLGPDEWSTGGTLRRVATRRGGARATPSQLGGRRRRLP